jgi:glycosyltransferase involved in cell wall biosynthesis
VARKPLHIAWIGFAPIESGGVPGVAGDLLHGLAVLGHRIDCYVAGDEHELPQRLQGLDNITFIWGKSGWRSGRWYSSSRLTATVSQVFFRISSSLRLRGEVARRHRRDPYDLSYEFATVENLALPARLRREVPLVAHPETHSAGELRSLIVERRLSLRCQPAYTLLIGALVLSVRTLVQRRRIRSADLLVCISSVFRDHMIRDYHFPLERTVVVPNPVRLERFDGLARPRDRPPTVLVLGRIAARKGIDDVVAIARLLLERGVDAHFRIVGGTSLWSNYLKLLDDLPEQSSEYVGRVPASRVPVELAGSDVLLQASKYEPFALTVGEALAAGVPVVATTEVGAIEGVDGSVAHVSAPGDVEALAAGITTTLQRMRTEEERISAKARAEAQRLFAPEVVCLQISDALQRLAQRPEPQENGSARA